MKKIPIGIRSGAALPSGDIVSDEYFNKLVAQSRWCPGIALMGEHKIPCLRLKTLDGYMYKIDGQIADKVDAFNPSEYLPWRDGAISDDQI